MVKNSTGGGKAKGFARKNLLPSFNHKLRVSIDPLELYAIVTKMLGNGRCFVNAFVLGKTTQLICVIRAKFSGRSKRSNFIGIGHIVLVGLRDFTSNYDTCDLLDIYDSNDLDALYKIPGFDFPGRSISFNSDFTFDSNYSIDSLTIDSSNISSNISSIAEFYSIAEFDDI